MNDRTRYLTKGLLCPSPSVQLRAWMAFTSCMYAFHAALCGSPSAAAFCSCLHISQAQIAWQLRNSKIRRITLTHTHAFMYDGTGTEYIITTSISSRLFFLFSLSSFPFRRDFLLPATPCMAVDWHMNSVYLNSSNVVYIEPSRTSLATPYNLVGVSRPGIFCLFLLYQSILK